METTNYLNINDKYYAVDVNKLECDYYSYLKKGKPMFLGEYMAQYSWAEVTCGLLTNNGY